MMRMKTNHTILTGHRHFYRSLSSLGLLTVSGGRLLLLKCVHDRIDFAPNTSQYILTKLSSSSLLPVAFQLRKFKFSPFLPNQTCRNTITDFAVVISILIWSLIGNAFADIPIEKLNVPSKISPTFQCCDASCTTSWPNECYGQEAPYGYRSWVVNLSDVNGKTWVPFMAAGPALLAFVLVFLDDGITWHLINHPSHKLKHGDAYNWDTIVIGAFVLVNSILGLPWLVAATVRSLNHIHAMAEKLPDGTFVSVHETRLSNLGIHLLVLVTVFALDVLKLIPVPVLYGVFLFMVSLMFILYPLLCFSTTYMRGLTISSDYLLQGLVSLGTNQFWGRMLMFFMQPSKYPVQPYTQFMAPKRMHLFTAIQLFFFAALYVVKSIKVIAIAFPILIALCIPVRVYLLPKIFTRDELILIDSDPDQVKMWIAKREAEEEMLLGSEGEDEGDVKEHEGQPDVEEGNVAAVPAAVDTARPRSRRGNRTKTLSMPAGHFLFQEEPSVLGPQLRPQITFGGANAGSMFVDTFPTAAYQGTSALAQETLEGMDLASAPKKSNHRRPRPSRAERRSSSCPVNNMMFEIQIDTARASTNQRLRQANTLATLDEPTGTENVNSVVGSARSSC